MHEEIEPVLSWDEGFQEWKRDELARIKSHACWVVKSIRRLCNTQKLKQGVMRCVPLRSTIANSLRYWWKMEGTRREELRIMGCRARHLQDCYLRNKVEEVKAALIAAGIEVTGFDTGVYREKKVRIAWDVHAKGIWMYAWCEHKMICEASYYAQMRFKNKTLDLLLDTGR